MDITSRASLLEIRIPTCRVRFDAVYQVGIPERLVIRIPEDVLLLLSHVSDAGLNMCMRFFILSVSVVYTKITVKGGSRRAGKVVRC